MEREIRNVNVMYTHLRVVHHGRSGSRFTPLSAEVFPHDDDISHVTAYNSAPITVSRKFGVLGDVFFDFFRSGTLFEIGGCRY